MVIGLDIGGTNIKGVLMNGKKTIAGIKVPTISRTDKNLLINQVFDIIRQLKSDASKVEKIGVAVAGPVDFKKQRILNPPNIVALKNSELSAIIKKEFGIKTIIDHDVNCFVLAEATLGAGKDYKSVFGVTLGTGVGGGMVIDKKVYRGAHGSAGEVGHITIDRNGRKCKCGNRGCLEPYICDAGVKQAAKKIFKKGVDSLRIFDNLAKKNDKRAIKLYATIGEYLGIGLANIVDTINPEIIVVGGGILRAGKFILEPARKEMRKNILSQGAKKTKILKSRLGKFAGAIGATLLIL